MPHKTGSSSSSSRATSHSELQAGLANSITLKDVSAMTNTCSHKLYGIVVSQSGQHSFRKSISRVLSHCTQETTRHNLSVVGKSKTSHSSKICAKSATVSQLTSKITLVAFPACKLNGWILIVKMFSILKWLAPCSVKGAK